MGREGRGKVPQAGISFPFAAVVSRDNSFKDYKPSSHSSLHYESIVREPARVSLQN